MNLTLFIVLPLVTWRLASLFVNEVGPFEMFRKIRDEYYNRKGLHKFINLDCVWCLSVYIGWALALFTIGFKLFDVFMYGLAFSAIAIVIESIVRFFIAENEKVLDQQHKKRK